jgi:hypothetical protein
MGLVENIFVITSGGLIVAGLVMVGAAVQAYVQTERCGMVYLSVGFTLIVAATAATALGAILTNFAHTRTLLIVNNGFSMCGYLFVIYSVFLYE